jgi:hypothetical protein
MTKQRLQEIRDGVTIDWHADNDLPVFDGACDLLAYLDELRELFDGVAAPDDCECRKAGSWDTVHSKGCWHAKAVLAIDFELPAGHTMEAV